MEDPGGGGEEGQEEEDETDLSTLGSCFLNGNCGTLECRESGGLLLHLHLCLLHLSYNLLIDLLLDLHLVEQVGPLGLSTLGTDITMGIGKAGIGIACLLIALFGLGKDFLIVFQILADFRGTIIGDKCLQTSFYRVSHRSTDHRILIGDIDGDNHGLVIDIADDILINGLAYVCLFLGQTERINLVFRRLRVFEETDYELLCSFNSRTPPRGFLLVLEIGVIRHRAVGLALLLVALDGDRHLEEGSLEVNTVHQIRIKHWTYRICTTKPARPPAREAEPPASGASITVHL